MYSSVALLLTFQTTTAVLFIAAVRIYSNKCPRNVKIIKFKTFYAQSHGCQYGHDDGAAKDEINKF